ncbi:MAG: hypothetical protein KGM97_02655 [Alphaproteobacteria bacterium]|nr:hypothetical protein [Alphaproteobacteria bacterium]MDE2629870.1 hypothetical protein [Alphaproteobacteria bacterium]
MNRQPRAVARHMSSSTVGSAGLFFTIGFFGLLPMGLAVALMLTQILSAWPY